MHKLLKKDKNFIWKVHLPNWIDLDLSKLSIKYDKLKLWKKYKKDKYDVFYDKQFIWRIIFYFKK